MPGTRSRSSMASRRPLPPGAPGAAAGERDCSTFSASACASSCSTPACRNSPSSTSGVALLISIRPATGTSVTLTSSSPRR